jgi:hypothetical protein
MVDFHKIYIKVTPDEEMGVYIGGNGTPYSVGVVLGQLFTVKVGEFELQAAVHLSAKGGHYVVTDVRSGCQWPDHIQKHHATDDQGNRRTTVQQARAHIEQQLENAARNHAGPNKVASAILTWPEFRPELIENGILDPDEQYPE